MSAKKKSLKKIIIIVIICAVTVVFAGAVKIYKSGANSYSGVSQHIYASVFEKLAAGDSINVLVVGDSIGQGAGAAAGKGWASLLPSAIESKYNSKCNITNVSMGGNTSYAGIVRVDTLDDGIEYDLVIVCFGENDSEEELSSQYEALIRSIRYKYGNCDIISILESSQREYTAKIKTIIDIDNRYSIPIADTIDAFDQSGYSYEELVNAPDDLIHPNDLGHEIYLTTIMDAIAKQVDNISQFDERANDYNRILFFDKKEMSVSGLYRFKITLDEPVTTMIGLYRNYIPGENGVKVYVDGKLVYDDNTTWNYAEQSHIYQITDEPIYIERVVEIEFSSLELARRFYGIIFTDECLE